MVMPRDARSTPRRGAGAIRAAGRRAGYTLVEVACAFAVLSVLASTVFVSEGHSVKAVARSFRSSAALHLAAGRLEELAADPAALVPGTSTFVVDAQSVELLPYHRAYQSVRELEPGLFEVTTELSWMEHERANRERVQLTTLMTRAAPERQ